MVAIAFPHCELQGLRTKKFRLKSGGIRYWESGHTSIGLGRIRTGSGMESGLDAVVARHAEASSVEITRGTCRVIPMVTSRSCLGRSRRAPRYIL